MFAIREVRGGCVSQMFSLYKKKIKKKPFALLYFMGRSILNQLFSHLAVCYKKAVLNVKRSKFTLFSTSQSSVWVKIKAVSVSVTNYATSTSGDYGG